MADVGTKPDWTTDDAYWKQNYKRRPYVEAGREYGFYSPAYRFGFESAERYRGKGWNEAESDLRRDWDRYEHRGQSTWEQMKNAIKDAWDRTFGKIA